MKYGMLFQAKWRSNKISAAQFQPIELCDQSFNDYVTQGALGGQNLPHFCVSVETSNDQLVSVYWRLLNSTVAQLLLAF